MMERSEEAQEILSHKPGFMERWALPGFLVILLLICGGTWFIKYPEVIEANAVLTSVNAARYYVRVNLRQTSFGKVEAGQKVQLRFKAYPYQEFGYVAGRLNYVSKASSDTGFFATVELINGLTTSYKKIIPYKYGLIARALIVTREARLSQKLFKISTFFHGSDF